MIVLYAGRGPSAQLQPFRHSDQNLSPPTQAEPRAVQSRAGFIRWDATGDGRRATCDDRTEGCVEAGESPSVLAIGLSGLAIIQSPKVAIRQLQVAD